MSTFKEVHNMSLYSLAEQGAAYVAKQKQRQQKQTIMIKDMKINLLHFENQ